MSQRAILNQVQTIPCGHFTCQVRNLFLNVAASSNDYINSKTNKNSSSTDHNHQHHHSTGTVKRIRKYHWGSSTAATTPLRSTSTALHLVHSKRNYSRFSANTIQTGTAMMKLTDYDCIGFDLDNVCCINLFLVTLILNFAVKVTNAYNFNQNLNVFL